MFAGVHSVWTGSWSLRPAQVYCVICFVLISKSDVVAAVGTCPSAHCLPGSLWENLLGRRVLGSSVLAPRPGSLRLTTPTVLEQDWSAWHRFLYWAIFALGHPPWAWSGFPRAAPLLLLSLLPIAGVRSAAQSEALCLLLLLPSSVLPSDKALVLVILSQHLRPRGPKLTCYECGFEDLLRIVHINYYRKCLKISLCWIVLKITNFWLATFTLSSLKLIEQEKKESQGVWEVYCLLSRGRSPRTNSLLTLKNSFSQRGNWNLTYFLQHELGGLWTFFLALK